MRLLASLVRLRAVAGLALAQLRRAPGRTVLTIGAVALAVLSVTLLASLGVGVVEIGERGLDQADRDIWVSNEPVDPAASGTGNSIVDAHAVAASLQAREDIRTASPVAMHGLFVGTNRSDLRRVPAVGVQRTHAGFDFERGGGFALNRSDYADASAGEPARAEIVLDPRTAEALGVGVGDTVRVGGSRATTQPFTVVGIASHYSQYLSAPAATVPVVDLQTLTGTFGTDRATFVMADTTAGASPAAVRDAVADEYPAYDVRTGDQQVEKLLRERPLVLASGATLIGFAVLGGAVLTINLFALVAYQQRDELAALRAIGLSRGVLAGTIGTQGIVIGVLGGIVGVAATRPIAAGLNRLARRVVGFETLLRPSVEIYAAGIALAVGLGAVVALLTGWQAGRYARVEQLLT
ncbi:putative ABC transport system permease protein [Natronoarchaeum philippinense]|uniref:Putative ABC transport system permease protein n=1 Tax=Natronoarchaeum philippinense TaxID=558529 RepID=A0A285NB22_NATPI|nr:ABC transporter permease [Natronoarchaeum philippinense]SNZ04871.1 putative ABC transport system permease protein [Natronoarchaeum philippinense]